MKSPILVVVCTALLVPCAAHCQSKADPPAASVLIDTAAAKEDPRLDNPVSLSTQAMPLKAVLNSFAAQTGIPISMDERDPASGYRIQIECIGVPVWKMMDAIYSVFGITRGEWSWTRAAKAGNYAYTLHETSWAKDRAATYNRIVDGLLTNYLGVMRDLAPLPMQERLKHKELLRKALLVNTDEDIIGMLTEEGPWTEAILFQAALSDEQQSQVLHGGDVSVDLNSASPDVRAIYHKYYQEYGPRSGPEDGSPVIDPEPDSVTFFLSAPSRSGGRLAAAIGLATPARNMRLSGFMGTGILDFGVKAAIRRAWFLPGDSETDPAEKSIVKESEDTASIRNQKTENARHADMFAKMAHPGMSDEVRDRIVSSMKSSLDTPSALYKISKGAYVPIVAVLPAQTQSIGSSGFGDTVGDYVHKLDNRSQLVFCKWRNGVLLINHPLWFAEPAFGIPYSELSKIRLDKSGSTPLSKWVEFMHDISDEQADWFGDNYNVSKMKSLRACMEFLYEHPGALSTGGANLDQPTIQELVSVNVLPHNREYSPDGALVRVSEIPALPLRGISRRLSFELFDTNHKKWYVMNSNFEFPAQIEAVTKPATTP